MGWRERFGGDDERAQIAARARALLDAAGARPWPGDSSSWEAGADRAAPVPPLPPPRGGWVPAALPVEDDGGRHAVASSEPTDVRGLPVVPSPVVPSPVVPSPVVPSPVVRSPGPVSEPSRPWRERIRLDPGRRGLVAVAAVVVVVGSVAGGVMFRGGSSSAVTVAAASGAPAPSAASAAPVASASGAEGRSASPSGPATASGSATASGTAAGTVTVDVAGRVVHPGVYTLPAGSRVEDALRAAGGVTPGADLSTLNRARVLVDGEQLAVGVPGAAAPPAASPGGASPAAVGAGGLVDLNTAGLADLDTLPGVGPVLAQKILDWRTDHGRFSSVDDLQQVSGIGPTRFADLRDLVTV